MPRRARFSKRRVARDAPAPSDPIWLLCHNDGTQHPVSCTPTMLPEPDRRPGCVERLLRSMLGVSRARRLETAARRDGYDNITKLSYGCFVTEKDAAKPSCPPTYASPPLRLLNPSIGFGGLRPWEATRDPDGLFALFVEATESDIVNAISEKARFPEIADRLDEYLQALQIRREIVAEGRDRTGERNGDLLNALLDFELSQQR